MIGGDDLYVLVFLRQFAVSDDCMHDCFAGA